MSADLSPQVLNKGSDKAPMAIEPFSLALSKHGIVLGRDETRTLQVNVGLLCSQSCRHCHLSAAPGHRENMDSGTAEQIVEYAQKCSFETIDITGGEPELNPNLGYLIDRISPLATRIMLRSNLSTLSKGKQDRLMERLLTYRVVIVASFPSINEAQADSQRGKGAFQKSVEALKKLNDLGYGRPGSGLELNLVSNPTGAFLPYSQPRMEKRFREVLEHRWGIVFNNLFTFANVPLGRFREWLEKSGNLENYINKLVSGFNPCAVEGVMCRTMVSVSWDGHLYDCDFNLAKGLHMGGRKIHVSEMDGPPMPGDPIAFADHCYTCTAGSGFT